MNATGELLLLGEAVPYTYIGDSHAGAIGSLVFEDPESSTRIVTKTLGIWRFVAADAVDDDGMIGEPLMQALRRAGAFHSLTTFPPLPGLRPTITRYGRERLVEYLAPTDHARDVPFILSVGEINNRYLLHQLVIDEVDFDVPFPIDGLERLPDYAARQTLRADQMLRVLADEFNPLFRGLRILRDAGMRTIFLHSIAPPAVDDADAERVLKHPSPARLRYKLAMFVNYLYDAVCRDIGIGFIDMWPQVTTGNLLDPEYYLDGLHLNRKHSQLSVTEVRRQLRELSR